MANDDAEQGAAMKHLALEDQAALGQGRPSKSARGGGGSRRGGGGGGGGGAKGREFQLSKALSKLLRHHANSVGIKLDEGGWAELGKVTSHGPIKSLKPTMDEIRTLVADSDKQRFALKPNPLTNPDLDTTSNDFSHYLIRANQGHSIKLADPAALLTPITLEAGNVPETVFHGTYVAFWPAIEASGGLKRMTRNHVHFATALPEDIKKEVSGMRKDAEILVHMDVEASLREGGMTWWLSENGVVLTEGNEDGIVPSRFFKEVAGRLEGVGKLWENGEKVGEIPDELRNRPGPRGKNGGRGGRGGGRERGGRGRGA